MAKLRELELGEDGVKYLESCLQKGGSGLCLELAKKLPLYSGKVFGVVPENVSLDRAKQFSGGGLHNLDDAYNWLAKHVEGLTLKNPNATFVIQDVWGALPTDPIVLKRNSDMFFNQSNVYNFVETANFDFNYAVSALREVASFLIVGIFSNFPIKVHELPRDRFVSDDLIVKLAENAQEIYVNAYDQESFVIWKSDQPPT